MVSKHLWVGPLVSLLNFYMLQLWLVVQVGDTVVALFNWRLDFQLCYALGLYLSRNGLTFPAYRTSTNSDIALYHGAQ
jgi:hypothetical protein